MKESNSTPSELTELLRTAPLGVPTPSELAEEEARLVPWLENRIAQVPAERLALEKKRKIRAVGYVALASILVAAGVLLSLNLRNAPSEEAREARAATESPKSTETGAVLVDGEVESGPVRVLVGSRLGLVSGVTTKIDRRAKLLADDGYTLELGTASSLRLLSLESSKKTELALETGSVELSVPKLGSGRTLEVQAGKTTVVVHGTRFFVGYEKNGAEARVCTSVSEGKVEVRVEGKTVTYLDPGESYGCGEKIEPNPGATAARPRVKSSSLAEENALLRKALKAEREGNPSAAERTYRELLERYPSSGFVPEANAGLARVTGSRKR